jgi:hypothetical protein
VVNTPTCQNCQLNRNCAYAYIFETPHLRDTLAQYESDNLPHPFVIEPPATNRHIFESGEKFQFGLVLIGKAFSFLPYFIFAFHQLGSLGLGKGKGKFWLESVLAVNQPRAASDHQIYDGQTQIMNSDYETWTLADVFNTVQSWATGRLHLEFLTPTRILHHNQLISQLNFEIFIRTLVRRISLLGRVHCQSDWDLPYVELIEQCKTAAQIETSQLQWRDWERYSNRQQRRMKFGGIVGQVIYQGALRPFLPLIFLGQFIHLGKNTTFGLGRFRIADFGLRNAD